MARSHLVPAYDYRCIECGTELELVHRMSESVERRAHVHRSTGAECDGALERLIALVGVNQQLGASAVGDPQLQRAGFTKYVRGTKGYEKAFGSSDSPGFIRRE